MVIKPLAITDIKTSPNWRFSIELFNECHRIVVAPTLLRANRTSADMSTIYHFAAAQVLRTLTGAQPLRWLGSRSIPLPHLRERPRAKGKDAD
ncbi:hypothetical protein [Bradyrhizobium vignae]|uniref:Uncharacterized protein n=1 Tax=Bradyrhizobium vignae TaxID=1549949 RepID=A0ABS3ZS81_9BRAD|nr:hypothetical protein [Bradyrhizobium vignae]MBP0111008.1 hypothetical protein [Bradyrhizobium vignae]